MVVRLRFAAVYAQASEWQRLPVILWGANQRCHPLHNPAVNKGKPLIDRKTNGCTIGSTRGRVGRASCDILLVASTVFHLRRTSLPIPANTLLMSNPSGRPSPPPEEALDDRLNTRVNRLEKQAWKAAAKAAKMSFSNWLRRVLNDATSVAKRIKARDRGEIKRGRKSATKGNQ